MVQCKRAAVTHSRVRVVGLVGPVELLSYGVMHSTFASAADEKRIVTEMKERGRTEVRTIRCNALCKVKTQTNTPSQLAGKGLFGFPTDGNAKPWSELMDCAEINSPSVGIPVLALSVMPAIMSKTGIKDSNGPLDSSINTKSGISVRGTHGNVT